MAKSSFAGQYERGGVEEVKVVKGVRRGRRGLAWAFIHERLLAVLKPLKFSVQPVSKCVSVCVCFAVVFVNFFLAVFSRFFSIFFFFYFLLFLVF